MRPMSEMIRDRRPVTVLPEDSVGKCCATMHRNRIGAVLVMEGGRLLGIFTGRDAVRCLAEAVPTDTPVREAMTWKPVTIAASEGAIHALRLMSDHGFRHLPVVDAAGAVVGIVSRYDFRAREHGRHDEETGFFEVIR